MPSQYWCKPATPMTAADGPAVTAAALTDASPVTQKTVPVAEFLTGTTIRMRASGEYSTASATPTLTLGFYWGTVGSIGSATVIASGPAMTIAAAATSWPWEMDWEGEVRALGTSGQVKGQGSIYFANTATGLSAAKSVFPLPITAAGRLVTVNTLTAQSMMVGCTWSSVTGTPSLTCTHVTLEIIG